MIPALVCLLTILARGFSSAALLGPFSLSEFPLDLVWFCSLAGTAPLCDVFGVPAAETGWPFGVPPLAEELEGGRFKPAAEPGRLDAVEGVPAVRGLCCCCPGGPRWVTGGDGNGGGIAAVTGPVVPSEKKNDA